MSDGDRIARLVASATSESLLLPDWGLIMDLCDVARTDASSSTRVVSCIMSRLASAGNAKASHLCLLLLESLFKNSTPALLPSLISLQVCEGILAASGSASQDVSLAAAGLLQHMALAWGEHPTLAPLCTSTLARVRVPLPAIDSDCVEAMMTATGGPAPESMEAALARVKGELELVCAAIVRVARALQRSSGSPAHTHDVSLHRDVDFLLQVCPRVDDLIQAALVGVGDETLVASLIATSTALHKALDATRAHVHDCTSTCDASVASHACRLESSVAMVDLTDLCDGALLTPATGTTSTVARGREPQPGGTGLDLLLTPPPAAAPPPPQPPVTDDFMALFAPAPAPVAPTPAAGDFNPFETAAPPPAAAAPFDPFAATAAPPRV